MFGGLTVDQIAIFLILAGVLGMLIWDKLRYDLVALAALLLSIAVGIVPADKAFRGFSDDIVIIVGSALVVSAAVARSGLADTLIRPLANRMKTTEVQVGVLVLTVAVLSAFMKNIEEARAA